MSAPRKRDRMPTTRGPITPVFAAEWARWYAARWTDVDMDRDRSRLEAALAYAFHCGALAAKRVHPEEPKP